MSLIENMSVNEANFDQLLKKLKSSDKVVLENKAKLDKSLSQLRPPQHTLGYASLL